ncbi:BTAD domain-containing putative transcriptional regulator [Nocardia sp. XZ_19_385]|uniref:BTAD domain-containing putative transcriptional regulator n=1 Tax=Nocardia sp. XZ_19_385 TaxID=2769488 RepID=UPI001E658AC7|nr:BTAD domain-containing putative transcriptional regulator [Nocardia sp. XZ_19_385]
MRFGVLGPLTVWTDAGAVVPIPGAKVRALLADLLVHAGQPVSGDRLVDDIWAEDPPGNPAGTLAAKASQLRRALEDAEPGGRDLVVSPPPGYRLGSDQVDALRFRGLLAAAREATDSGGRVRALTDALGLWRGPAFADFRDTSFAQPAIAQLEEQRLVAVEELAEARLALGEYREVAGDLAGFVREHPLRERLRAAQLRALYGAGRQAEALDSYEDLRRHLDDELGLDPSPELVALQRAILGQELELVASQRKDIAAPTPIRRRTTNIPAQRTALIGRDSELDELRRAVGDARLVTLTGPGGVGKTRLAAAVAAELAGPFPHGAWMIEFAPLPPAEGATVLADTVAQALGLRAAEGTPADPVELLCRTLADQELLLVLDNCEHVVDAAAELAETLLGAAPRLHILATSQEQLRLPGEDIVPVRPLTVPDREATLSELENSSAAQLFVARARAGARDFVLDADTAAPVATLCRRLDGIPLALELAATRVRALGVHEMVARLDDRFRLLATGHRGAPPRQQTLTAMIDWSWSLLDDTERAVLRRLSVHAGGCTLDAAETVCSTAVLDDVVAQCVVAQHDVAQHNAAQHDAAQHDAAQHDAAQHNAAQHNAAQHNAAQHDVAQEDVADTVARLVDRSLVQLIGRRYRLLESVAAFSSDQLRKADESDAAHAAHHRYYLQLAERAAPELYGADQQRWLERLDAEAANLRTALDGFLRERDAERALRMTRALAWYWQLRGRFGEARRNLAAALALGGPAHLRAPALAWDLGFACQQGESADAAVKRAEVLALYDTVDDPAGRARAELLLALFTMDTGDLRDLEALVGRALPACEQVGDRWGMAAAHVALAKTAHSRAEVTALEQHARSAARIFTELGDRWGRLQAAEWLGGLAELTGDLTGAAEIHREALELAQELRWWSQACSHLCWLGWISMQHSAFDRATALAEQGLRLATEHGSAPGRTFAAIVLAFTARRDGRPEEAEKLLRELIALADGPDTPLFLPMLQVELGYLHEQQGDPATALALHLTALDGAQRIAAPRDTAFALAGLASASTALGEFTTAAHLLGTAAALRATTHTPLLPAEIPDIERPTAALRTALGEQAFAAAYDAGTGLDLAGARALVTAVSPRAPAHLQQEPGPSWA